MEDNGGATDATRAIAEITDRRRRLEHSEQKRKHPSPKLGHGKHALATQ
jgi:hypothetical protein